MGRINFTKEIIEVLSKDPRVKYIDSKTLKFTLEFRQQLYDAINPNFTVSNLRKAMKELRFKIDLYPEYCNRIIKQFKIIRPCGSSNTKVGEYNYNYTIDKSYDEYLISTSLFIKTKKGIKPTKKLMEDIYAVYPQTSVSEYLESRGIDLNRFGIHRLYQIEYKLKDSSNTNDFLSNEDVTYLKKHPYVKKVTNNILTFNENFYQEAQIFKHLHINEILDIFEIGSSRLNYHRKNNLKFKLNYHVDKEVTSLIDNVSLLVKIERNKLNVLLKKFNDDMNLIKENKNQLSCFQKKELCKFIKECFETKDCFFTLKELLDMCGISKSSYYSVLKNDNYGKGEETKELKDLNDKALIEEVINSNKYPKGNRMIYMLLKRKNHPMSRNKIYRLFRKFDIKCMVRKHNKSRQVMRELLDRNVKDNLVKRKFRLSKPNLITLTDVSYLKCSFGTVYLSSLKDASSGKVKLLVSKNNNLDLAMDTLKLLDENKGEIKIFHSDQGILYLNDEFQARLKSLGYTQSMSKRGNCWDNSPQESFFGHTKDEIDFSCLNSFEEVAREIKEYEHYYNYERPQWNRCMMTPIEFEAYINSLNEPQYKEYYDKELIKYNKMMDNARTLAIKRAKNMGITINI